MKPNQTFRDGAIGLSIWERSGSKGPYFEFTLSRSFKAKDGKTGYSTSFRAYDAQSIHTVIDLAAEYIRGRSNGTAEELAAEGVQEGEAHEPPAAGGL